MIVYLLQDSRFTIDPPATVTRNGRVTRARPTFRILSPDWEVTRDDSQERDRPRWLPGRCRGPDGRVGRVPQRSRHEEMVAPGRDGSPNNGWRWWYRRAGRPVTMRFGRSGRSPLLPRSRHSNRCGIPGRSLLRGGRSNHWHHLQRRTPSNVVVPVTHATAAVITATAATAVTTVGQYAVGAEHCRPSGVRGRAARHVH